MNNAWIYQLLTALNAPWTDANVEFLQQWQPNEGQGILGANNPLAISQSSGWGGSNGNWNTLPNGNHVLMFPDLQTGVNATVQWLNQGYTDVIAMLRSGNPKAYAQQNPSVITNMQPAWSYAPNLFGSSSSSSSASPSSSQQTSSSAPSTSGGTGGSLWQNPIKGFFSDIQNTVLVFVAGIVLIIIGGIWFAVGNKDTIVAVTKDAAKAAPEAAA